MSYNNYKTITINKIFCSCYHKHGTNKASIDPNLSNVIMTVSMVHFSLTTTELICFHEYLPWVSISRVNVCAMFSQVIYNLANSLWARNYPLTVISVLFDFISLIYSSFLKR